MENGSTSILFDGENVKESEVKLDGRQNDFSEDEVQRFSAGPSMRINKVTAAPASKRKLTSKSAINYCPKRFQNVHSTQKTLLEYYNTKPPYSQEEDNEIVRHIIENKLFHEASGMSIYNGMSLTPVS